MEGDKKPSIIHKTIRALGFGSARKDVESGKEPASDEWGSYKCQLSEKRLFAHVSTDKPMYRSGETVYVRAAMVGALNEAPCGDSPRWLQPRLQILSPKGDAVFTTSLGQPSNAVIHGSWKVPEGQAGGEYTVKLTFGGSVNPPAERKIQIRAFRNPKLRVKIDFVGSGYGPGDKVLAKISVTRSEGGGKPFGAKVTTTARVDGAIVHGPVHAELDSDGLCQVSFSLPEEIAEGMGSLTAVVEDGGIVESGSKTLPLVLRSLNVKFFPEGGPLVAGVENRVYFEAMTPTEEPVELQGEIWASSDGSPSYLVTTISAMHEGRGRFSLPAKAGEKYELHVVKPRGVEHPVSLPQPETCGPEQKPLVAITASKDAYESKRSDPKELTLTLASAQEAKVRVAVFKREEELCSADVELPPGGLPLAVSFPLKDERSGVLRATVFSDDGVPLAERLVFVKPAESLQVEVTCPTEDSAVPGADQVVEIRVRDANGKPVKGAVVGLCVTDVTTIDMVEDRRKAPRLPAMVYLEGEVKHLEDSHAYLQSTDNGALALDLLLGTQGWRRFAYRAPLEKLVKSGDGAKAAEVEPFARLMGIHLSNPDPVSPDRWQGRGGRERLFQRDGDGAAFRRLGLPLVPRRPAMPPGMPMLEAMMAPPQMAVPVYAVQERKRERQEGEKWREEGINLKASVSSEEDEESEGEGCFLDLMEDVPPMAPPVMLPSPPKIEKQFPEVVEEEVSQMKEAMVIRRQTPQRAEKKKIAFQRPSFDAVRVYAHPKKSGSASAEEARTDFTETVYWNAASVTSADGVARAEFALSDSVTSFAVLADVHVGRGDTRCGAFGASESFRLSSRRPVYAEAKVPLELTTGDSVKLPIIVINSTGDCIDATICASLQEPLSTPDAESNIILKVPESKRVRHILPVKVLPPKMPNTTTNANSDKDEGSAISSASVTISLTASTGSDGGTPKYKDTVKRMVDIAPLGFPMEASFGGMLHPGAAPTGCLIRLPSSLAEGSLSASINIYVTPVGSLTQALEALLTEPYGCFEQASSTVYPNIMAQLYFKTHSGVDPAIVKRSYSLLEKGFEKLKGYEVDGSGGYDWFGHSPAHEALTAYGLLEFTDMAKVFPVPQAMLKRTTTWLLTRKDDGAGGFQLNPKQLDSFGGAPADVTTAYIVWSLTYAGIIEGLKKQVASLEKQAESKADAYFRGLVAGTLYNVGRPAPAQALAQGLLKFQRDDGSVTDAETSITRSGGESLVVETSSIAILVWLNDLATFGGAARKAVEWLATRCKNGRFGSTQGTILALKAIIAYDQAHACLLAPGTAHLLVDGELLQSLPFDDKTKDTLSFDGAALVRRFKPGGEYVVEVKMEKGYDMPFSAQVRYHTEVPPSSKGCDVSLSVSLASSDVKEGDTADVAVTVQNLTNKPLPMTVAIVGFPGGLEPRHDQLKELVTQNIIAFYEVKGREVVLYWRTIPANASVSLRIEGTAAVPGQYVGPASRAYLYYTDEFKAWVQPLSVSIAPHT